ncbi:MAG: radical SAM protein [Planctomycetes bacterium]|nr:radical SAM protein [Planctomycetota bacterium]
MTDDARYRRPRNRLWRRILALGRHAAIHLSNYLAHFLLRSDSLRPVYAIYEMTYGCDLHCSYCDDGRGRPYPPQASETRPLPLRDAVAMLRKLRRAMPSIYLSGGEPTLHPDFLELLHEIDRLGFWPVMLNTNGLHLERLLRKDADFLRYVDILIVSVDSMDPAKLDGVLRAGPGAGRRVLEALDLCLKLRQTCGYTLAVNCVITKETLDDAVGVARFCKARRVKFAPVVANRGKGPMDPVTEEARYAETVDALFAPGGPELLSDPVLYEVLLRFRPFVCHPALRIHVTPDGRVPWPCQSDRRLALSVSDHESLPALLRESERRFPIRGQGRACGSPCYLAQNVSTDRYFTTTAWYAIRDLILKR